MSGRIGIEMTTRDFVFTLVLYESPFLCGAQVDVRLCVCNENLCIRIGIRGLAEFWVDRAQCRNCREIGGRVTVPGWLVRSVAPRICLGYACGKSFAVAGRVLGYDL